MSSGWGWPAETVCRAGVAVGILQETTIEALAHAGRFHPQAQLVAWLLGSAVEVRLHDVTYSYLRCSFSRLLAKRFPLESPSWFIIRGL